MKPAIPKIVLFASVLFLFTPACTQLLGIPNPTLAGDGGIGGDGESPSGDGPNGAGDLSINPTLDTDNDGDPDTTDCAPKDPTIHHPQLDPNSPHYDPFPQSANCCGYNLGKSGPAANQSFSGDKICHAGTCGDGISQDCSGKDVACSNDQDCDTFPAMDPQNNGCKAPPNNPSGSDCDDCDPTIHPGAAEICDGKDNNCNGLTDETCVSCDLDGDGYQRSDPASGCPDKNDAHPGMIDCNDEDSGVYPGSDKGMGGGTALGALRGLCRNKNPDGTPQDANCDGSGLTTCPPSAMVNGKLTPCDADGDGFIDSNLKAACDPMGKLAAYDCNDSDPHTYPGAPDKCGDGIKQNCQSDAPCNNDKDGDKYQGADDCNDADATVHPWATEVCDGVDNDCDGLIDELNPDATGMAMITNLAVTHCTDSSVGLCAGPHLGDCVCSGTSISQLHFDVKRMACPGETPGVDAQNGGSAARCYFANQPAPQSCNPMNPADDDCDGRVDAPDGKNLALVGQPCWGQAQGQCAPDKMARITGCDMTKMNCLSGFGVNSWLTCDNTAVCPTAELCNGLDDDCDGQLPANEQDLDGDGYIACGSSDPKYQNMGPIICQKVLAMNLKGCGDCADAPGTTGVLKINNAQINPGRMEVCDGVDNDCDTMTADGATDCPGPAGGLTCCGASGCKHTDSDGSNCDGCGMACNLPNTNPMCVAAACTTMSCMGQFGDCNGNPQDGCETNLGTSVLNCMKCGNVCPSPNNGEPICTNGVCSVGACMDPFKDCDMNPANGCEVNDSNDVNNCGACGVKCPMVANATVACVNKACVIGTCNAGFADCDHVLGNGCEININTNSSNCGACKTVCGAEPNAVVACANGVCGIASCQTTYKDCDMIYADGCEVNSATNVANCMACGNACKAVANGVPACVLSACVIGACTGTFKDCNNNYGDGCEDDTSMDVANCGSCGHPCANIANGVVGCKASVCIVGSCNAPFLDCDHTEANGCEINSSNSVSNCGSCGKVCGPYSEASAACVASACAIGACVGQYLDCNHLVADGCEVFGQTDVNNCGACGNVCGVGMNGTQCQGGKCVCFNNGECPPGAPYCNVMTEICQATSCTDGMRDGNETDVDCGGGNCDMAGKTCANGKQCQNNQDCTSGVCNNMSRLCVASLCFDGQRDNGETDVDCGGPNCAARCINGLQCMQNSDCSSGTCSLANKCVGTPCSDGVKDGNETDIDCGGGTCAKCADGKVCLVTGDCTDNHCLASNSGFRCATNVCPACTWVDPMGGCTLDVSNGLPDPSNTCVVNSANCELATCDGNGHCAPASSNVFCGCVNGVLQKCTGNSLGCGGGMFPCNGNFGCATMSTCKNTCMTSGDCAPNYCCNFNGCMNSDALCGTNCTNCTGLGQHCVNGTCM